MMEHELRPVQADIDDAYFEYGKKHQKGETAVQKSYCDRCGKEIAKKPVTLLRHRVYYGVTRLVDSKSSDDYWHDLCLDCENSFVLWYNHPEKDGGETDG